MDSVYYLSMSYLNQKRKGDVELHSSYCVEAESNGKFCAELQSKQFHDLVLKDG